jgi:hypothetical protein
MLGATQESRPLDYLKSEPLFSLFFKVEASHATGIGASFAEAESSPDTSCDSGPLTIMVRNGQILCRHSRDVSAQLLEKVENA